MFDDVSRILLTMSSCPARLAVCSTDLMLLLTISRVPGLASIRSFTMSLAPVLTARCRGVQPSLFTSWGSAPASSKLLTQVLS